MRIWRAVLSYAETMLSSDPQHWTKYNQAQIGRTSRTLHNRALELVPKEGHALDIGAGAGIETLEMLKHGLAVRSLGVLERTE